jgi:hypothetical protein
LLNHPTFHIFSIDSLNFIGFISRDFFNLRITASDPTIFASNATLEGCATYPLV